MKVKTNIKAGRESAEAPKGADNNNHRQRGK